MLNIWKCIQLSDYKQLNISDFAYNKDGLTIV